MKLTAIIILCILIAFVLAAQASYFDVSDQVLSYPKPTYDGMDASKPRLPISLKLIASGFTHITDLASTIHRPGFILVPEKAGKATWVNRKTGEKQNSFIMSVDLQGEMGLLGLAFHPSFNKNKKIYINYNPKGAPIRSRISEFTLLENKLSQEQILLEVEQKWNNHKAGQLAFGPDGALYFGLGDGGFLGDPHHNAQNDQSFLGKFIRVDVDRERKPEIWAKGFRNPWRFSFSPQGQPIVADVGQDRFEEINLVKKGKNYGWNVLEGEACFYPIKNCKKEGFEKPLYTYSTTTSDRAVVIGGFIAIHGPLKGKYVFADFMMGRIWAADFPSFKTIYSLGRWPLLPVAFGQTEDKMLYIADFKTGAIYLIQASNEL